MSQEFEMIGQVSPALERVATARDGWQGSGPAATLGGEMTDQADYSFRARRAALQTLGIGSNTPPMAGYVEPPMAALVPIPEPYPPAPERTTTPPAPQSYEL